MFPNKHLYCLQNFLIIVRHKSSNSTNYYTKRGGKLRFPRIFPPLISKCNFFRKLFCYSIVQTVQINRQTDNNLCLFLFDLTPFCHATQQCLLSFVGLFRIITLNIIHFISAPLRGLHWTSCLVGIAESENPNTLPQHTLSFTKGFL